MKISRSKNVIAPAAQVIVSGLVLFVLYRYLYDHLGIAQIGVWSLVLAATSVSRIGDLGLSAGVVRFVAQALGKDDKSRAIDVIQTVVITLGVFMAVFLFIGYPLFSLILSYLLPEQSVPMAIAILPYALISLWMMMLVSALSGALDGCLRLDLRSYITAVSHIIFLGMTVMLVPQFGLLGVAIAQVVQSVGLLVLLWWALKLQLKQLPIIPLGWKFEVLKDMFRYGVNFQIITLMNMLFDPLVKAMMSKFGGLEALGFYEMANGLILKCRAIIVEANRVLVPSVASVQQLDSEISKKLFIESYRLTFFVSVMLLGLLGVSISAICVLWLGHYQKMFVGFALLLNFGWFANTLIGPAYFYNLGTGQLKNNMLSHAIMGFASLVLGLIFGAVWEGLGVIIGAISGLILGSMFLLITHFRKFRLSLILSIIPEQMKVLFISALTLVGISNIAVNNLSTIPEFIGFAAIFCIFILILGWLNPVSRKLFRKD